jgi:hypothetical protein
VSYVGGLVGAPKLACGAPSSLGGGEHANTSAPHFHEADPQTLGCDQHPHVLDVLFWEQQWLVMLSINLDVVRSGCSCGDLGCQVFVKM